MSNQGTNDDGQGSGRGRARGWARPGSALFSQGPRGSRGGRGAVIQGGRGNNVIPSVGDGNIVPPGGRGPDVSFAGRGNNAVPNRAARGQGTTQQVRNYPPSHGQGRSAQFGQFPTPAGGTFQGQTNPGRTHQGGINQGSRPHGHYDDRGEIFQRAGRGRGAGGRGGHGRGGIAGVFSQKDVQYYSREETTKIENSSFNKSVLDQFQSLKLSADQTLPMRPGYGKVGAPVELFANYFEIIPKTPTPMCRYSVAILDKTEEQRPKGRKLARIIQLLLQQLPQVPTIVTDYRANIVTSQAFPSASTEYLVDYSVEGDTTAGNAQRFRVRVEYNTTLDLGDLLNYLSSPNLDTPVPTNKLDLIQALNFIIGNGFKGSSQVLTQKNKYFPFGSNRETFDLGSCLSAYRGYFLSARAATGRILLNTQVKHLAVYQSLRLDQAMNMLRAKGYSNAKTESFIRKLKVRLEHLPGRRIKLISGFASRSDGRGLAHPPIIGNESPSAQQVQFWKDDENKYVTVAQYFRRVHRTESKEIVINLGSRAVPNYCLAELCTIVEGQPFRSRLPPAQTTNMIEMAVQVPRQNAELISLKGRALIEQFSEASARGFGLDVGRALITVSGRMLAGPMVRYAQAETAEPRQGSWNMKQVKFTQQSTLPNWNVTWVKVKGKPNAFSDVAELDKCVGRFKAVLTACGVLAGKMTPTTTVEIESEENCEESIRDRFMSAKLAGANGPKLILFVLQSKSTAVYNVIKRNGDVTHGLHTICVIGLKLGKNRDRYQAGQRGLDPNAQFFANVALKFNLKLGGRNQALTGSDIDVVASGKTMLVGLDVTHPAPGEDSAPSIAAIVASVNKDLGQWPADIRIQQRRQEMVENLQEMFKSRLKLWQRHNRNELPEEIIIYRDGVSEGQYDLILTTELPQIREACAAIYPADRVRRGHPYITVIVVGKRHHTRFYPTSLHNADSSTGNPQSGTIVDRGVTESRIWDFYLQAHAAIKGTARPAHYVVVHDEIFRRRFSKAGSPISAVDALEKLTHNLCYLFGRATKAVSICPPAYYADIACERARCWLSRVFGEGASRESTQAAQDDEVLVHTNLRNTMFYI